MMQIRNCFFFLFVLLIFLNCSNKPTDIVHQDSFQITGPGSAGEPLRVMLVPADGGTEQGTLADYQPIFKAITRSYGLHFDLKVGQSYNAVVEAMETGKIEIAFFGPVTFYEAKKRGCAEFLAVGVEKGESLYYSGIFVRSDSEIQELQDLKGKAVAFGDVNSTSSFNYPIAMLLDAGIDPISDLSNLYLTGSHAYSLDALKTGKVDAACAAYLSFEKAVNNGSLNPEEFRPLKKSSPIPYPPLAMNVTLDSEIKRMLREAFETIHLQPGVTPDLIRGYGGKKVDRYDVQFSEEEFDKAMSRLSRVTNELKAEIIKKASSI